MIDQVKLNQLLNLIANGMKTVEDIKNTEYKAAVIEALSEVKP